MSPVHLKRLLLVATEDRKRRLDVAGGGEFDWNYMTDRFFARDKSTKHRLPGQFRDTEVQVVEDSDDSE